MKALYKCLSCGHTWEQNPGRVTCKCGHKLIKWVNYEEWEDETRDTRAT